MCSFTHHYVSSVEHMAVEKKWFFFSTPLKNVENSVDRITNKKISIIEKIESRIVYDLADRVAKMHVINITNR